MKKRLLTLVCLLGLTAGTALAYNPYAPNQFDTMERSSWEYQTVYALSQAGLTGADMGKFSPSYELTRYEMTQMVAAAIQHRNTATEQQRSQIDKLADAFSTDLEYVGTQKTTPSTPAAGTKFDWKK